MESPDARQITTLLNQMGHGDREAAERLWTLVYRQLRQLAARYMRSERPEHTLEPTALVHEVYLRIFGAEPMTWQNRAHFFAVAARQMRRVLVDHARKAAAGKRGGGLVKVTLDAAAGLPEPHLEDLATLDEVLDRLERIDPRAARVVELKFFSGLTDKEAALVLGVAVGVVRRDWEFARAWLFKELRSHADRR